MPDEAPLPENAAPEAPASEAPAAGLGQEVPVDVEAPRVIQGPAPVENNPSPGQELEGSGSCPAAAESPRVTAETEGGGETDAAAALAGGGPPSVSAPETDGERADREEAGDVDPLKGRRSLDGLDEQRRLNLVRLGRVAALIGRQAAELRSVIEYFDLGRFRSLLATLDRCADPDPATPDEKPLGELQCLRTWTANRPAADQQLIDGLDRAVRSTAAFQALIDLTAKVDAHAAALPPHDIFEGEVGAVRDANHDKAFAAASLDTRTVVDLVRGMLAIRRPLAAPAAA